MSSLKWKSIPLQILYPSSVSWKIILPSFFSLISIVFAQKEPIKVKIFETFKCSGQNSSNSSSQFWNGKSILLQILHHSSNSSVNFKLILFLLWIKGSHQSPNFETFMCFGETLSYSSCHFPNHKSVFFEILHRSSMSWKIILLYFFRSKIKYFPQQEQMKVQIVETLIAQVGFHQILVIFEITD